MRERFSPAVERTIQKALDTAGNSAADGLPAAVLFAALVEENDGRAARLLSKHGLSSDQARALLPGPSSAPTAIDKLLASARAISRHTDSEGTVTSEYLLLALIHSDAALRDRLIASGLRLAALEQEIIGDGEPIAVVEEVFTIATEPDRAGAMRALDANGNRAREALRVLDDYCRFVRDDRFFTDEIKRFRHELAELLDGAGPTRLLIARETESDVGTSLSADGEMMRTSPDDVAIVNLKRLQESLRSLEEFGKIMDRRFAEAIEQLRYRAYTLEKALYLSGDAQARLANARICVLLTGAQCTAALDWTIAEAAAGGATMFQLREKQLDDRRLLERARDVRRWTRQAGALFIVNDRPDIARLVEADGVHLGQEDMPVKEARHIVGGDAIIGVSTHNMTQVREAIHAGASYIGVGPTFSSSTKEFPELAGPRFVSQVAVETKLPAFAIGGINLETIDATVAAGASRVAVSAAVAHAEEPKQVVQALQEALSGRPRPGPA